MKPIDTGKDWTFEQIEDCYLEQQKIADDVFQLDYYPNQIEIISSEQMLDAYATTGMPVYYNHWSYGRSFVAEQEKYRRGQMGLAYEIVINSNPCISYLMEENTMMMQALVIAHAGFGHNSFFKNNCHFKQWTDAESIIDYLLFAKNYISECEHRYGAAEVERVIDQCHALRYHGIDRYKRAPQLTKNAAETKQKDRHLFEQQSYNDMWTTIPEKHEKTKGSEEKFPSEPEENILYFLEKHSPNLPTWKREIIRIVRKIAQYFYPQMLSQKMNEGWATFTHYNIIDEMYNRKQVTDGFMLDFKRSHTNVVLQRDMSGQLNPYAIGFAMYQDIKRVATNPTAEDEKWFRGDWVGSGDWLGATKYAMQNFKDESFIQQYLSPKVMRDFKLMYVLDDDNNPDMIVKAIQDDDGYRNIRDRLAENCNVNNLLPNIQVDSVDVWGDRSMQLIHHVNGDRKVLRSVETEQAMYHLANLWGYTVYLTSVDENGDEVDEYEMEPDVFYD